jgi:uncharacterized membrane protein YsdA (DUF1294 family)
MSIQIQIISLLAYIVILNLTGFIIMGNDKTRAKKQQYRIKESSLWKVAFLGGAVGSYIGMNMFRHKTKHNVFRFGLPVLAILELALFCWAGFMIYQG